MARTYVRRKPRPMSPDAAYAAHKQMILRLYADGVRMNLIAARVGFGMTPRQIVGRLEKDGLR